MVQQNCQEETTNSRNPLQHGANHKERELQWRFPWRSGRVWADRSKRWRWSLKRFLVCSRWLHFPSSYWTESSIKCVERRNISYSTETYWCHEVNMYRSGRGTRKTYWCCWIVDVNKSLSDSWTGFTKFFHFERKASKRIHVVRWETDNNSNNCSTRSYLARSLDKNWESRSKKRKTRMGIWDNETRKMRGLWKVFTPLIRMTKNTNISSRTRKRNGRYPCQIQCRAEDLKAQG